MTTKAQSKFSLTTTILDTLKDQALSPNFERALLSRDRTRVNRQNENEYWDYKEYLDLDNPNDIARLARWVLGFHNAKGGVIIVGVANDYKVKGYPQNKAIDTIQIKNKIRRYTGPEISIFQERVQTSINGKILWLIFIQKRSNGPLPALADGGQERDGHPIIHKDSFYIRVGDEVRRCVSPNDLDLLFRGVSFKHLSAYAYEVDLPFFRLLTPHHDPFVGRTTLMKDLDDALKSRSYIIALDGVGGVGKSALAIEYIRRHYRAHSYEFIFSLSAKNRVWHSHSESRQAGFSGFTELMHEMARVFEVEWANRPIDEVKADVINVMRGVRGLLLIDNIEEIHDDAVFEFLKNDVPDPVKVLVTSRISRDLGARTIAVPQMTEVEAVELLQKEFDRVGYHNYVNEDSEVEEILHATGNLPLAIKWVGTLAANCTSLRQVVTQIKGNDNSKREFLSFCFSTMYDDLSETARDVALLCPYLGEDWNTLTLSIALARPTATIEQAIVELEDRGLIFTTRGRQGNGMFALPLTLDFLHNKVHQNKALRDAVDERIRDLVASDDYRGGLLTMPVTERIYILARRAYELERQHEYAEALKRIRLALMYVEDDADSKLLVDVVRLRFLEGKITFLTANKRDGITQMEMALKLSELPRKILADEYLFLAHALLTHGRNNEQRTVFEYILEFLEAASTVPTGLLEECCKQATRQGDEQLLAQLITKIQKSEQAYEVATELDGYLDQPQFTHLVGPPLIKFLNLAASAKEATDEHKHLFTKLSAEMSARPGWKSN